MSVLTLSLCSVVLLLTGATATSHAHSLGVGESCLHEGAICESGLLCAGSNQRKKCVRPMNIGQRCGGDPFWVCAPDAQCVDHRCRTGGVPPAAKVPEGGNCKKANTVCVTGTICAGKKKGRKCIRPIAIGDSCNKSAYSICDDGLECYKRRCIIARIQEDGDCSTDGSICQDSLVCAGPEGSKKCVLPSFLGGGCGSDPYNVCAEGFDCVDGECEVEKVPIGGNCRKAGSVCESGTVCAGKNSRKKCVMPGKVGDKCDRTPFQVCEDNLECRKYKCSTPVIPEGGDCFLHGSECIEGAQCIGTETEKRCISPTAKGGSCEILNKFSYCESSLQCRDGKCQEPKLPVGGNCLPEGSLCEDGLVCAGVQSQKLCVTEKKEGEECDPALPLIVCEAGLVCMDERCRKPKVPEGGNCSEQSAICEDNLVCAGFPNEKKCVPQITEGQACDSDNPLSVCEGSLDCIDGRCSKPRIPQGQSCNAVGDICEENSVCVGPSGQKLCMAPMGVGKNCEIDPYWVCEEELQCENHVCREPRIPRGGDCTQGGTCADGSVCAGSSTHKLCVTPMSEGKSCGVDPFWVCSEGLNCEHNICRGPRVPRNGNCIHGGTCIEGTVCAGTSSHKICVDPMEEGKSCGRDPYWVCREGLSCSGYICRGPGGGEGDSCSREHPCSSGLSCVALDWSGFAKCASKASEGQRCGGSFRCHSGLTCYRGKCYRRYRYSRSHRW